MMTTMQPSANWTGLKGKDSEAMDSVEMTTLADSKDFRFTQEERHQYQHEGFVVRQGVFSDSEVDGFHEGIEEAVETALQLSRQGKEYALDGKRFVDLAEYTFQFEPNSDTDQLRVVEPVHSLSDKLAALLSEQRLLQPMQSILGCSSLSLWTDKLNCKGPGGSGFGWHQDSPYWIHDSDHVDLLPNVMVSFDSFDIENGCFRVIAGSHRKGCLPGRNDGSQMGGFYTDPSLIQLADEVLFEVCKGSLIFFDPHLIHGSGQNKTTYSRRAMILTFQPGGFPSLKSGETIHCPVPG
jgi:ectoine hydroxylase